LGEKTKNIIVKNGFLNQTQHDSAESIKKRKKKKKEDGCVAKPVRRKGIKRE